MMLIAFWAISSFGEPMKTVPSSSMSTEHFVSSMIDRIMRPPGPMTAPILSCGTVMRNIRGAKGDISLRGSAITAVILSRMKSRPTLACASAFSRIS